jgi:hypothetical protein
MAIDHGSQIEEDQRMVGNWRWFSVAALLVALGCLVCFSAQPLTAQAQTEVRQPKANVFIYPHKLTNKDKLTDGAASPIEIKSETTLIWVDLAPGARFSHATEYILISPEGSRLVKGQWWPILNGKALFRDGKSYKVDFPFSLPGNPQVPDELGPFPARADRNGRAAPRPVR